MRRVILFVVASLFTFSSFASHISGGDVSYAYLGNNVYQITFKIYRDCSNASNVQYDNPLHVTVFDTTNTILHQIDIPFPGSSNIPTLPPYPCVFNAPSMCIEEALYQTNITLPPLLGGYTITWQRCCRAGTSLNLASPSTTGITFSAHIPGPWANVNSSPVFNHEPNVATCSGVPITLDQSATDADSDSLVYSLCAPYDGASNGDPTPQPCTPPPYLDVNYVSPYSATNPLGSNASLSLDPHTGLLTATPIDIGQFVIGICVKEYRNGYLLSEHKREFQLTVANCTVSIPIDSVFGSTSICNQDTVQIGVVTGQAFHWSPDYQISDTLSSTPFVSPHQTTTYYVTASDSNCTQTDSVVIHFFYSVFASISPDSAAIYAGHPVALQASGGATYQWSPSTGLSSTTGAVVIAYPTQTTTYHLLAQAGSCASTDSVIVRVLPSSVHDSPYAAFALHPNPADSWLVIEPAVAMTANVKVNVINTAGQLLRSMVFDTDNVPMRIPVYDLPAGMYYLQLLSSRDVFTFNFTKL